MNSLISSEQKLYIVFGKRNFFFSKNNKKKLSNHELMNEGNESCSH